MPLLLTMGSNCLHYAPIEGGGVVQLMGTREEESYIQLDVVFIEIGQLILLSTFL